MKVEMTQFKTIYSLQDGDYGVVDFPRDSSLYGQLVFKKDNKTIIFNPDWGEFVEARGWDYS